MAKSGGTFAALQSKEYRRLWSGSLVAMVAFMMSFMLVPSVAFEISGSNAAAGFAQMGSGIAMVLVAPIGGVVADRLHKKPIVLAGQIAPALIILTVGILLITDHITVLLLGMGTMVMGLGFSFMGPARQAWVADLVPPDQLRNAIAVQQLAQNISQVAAPLLIAILVGNLLDFGQTYLFMATLFVIVLPLTLSLPNTPPRQKERKPIFEELMLGVRYVWSDAELRVLWLGFLGIVVCGFAFQTLLPGLLEEELGRNPSEVGPVFLALALFGLLVNLRLASLVSSTWAWPLMLIMGVILAGGYFVAAAAPSYAWVIMAAVPVGVGRSGFMLIDNALLMSNADPAYLGRVISLAMIGFGTQSLLAPVWGVTADLFGVRTALVAVGVVTIIITLAVGVAWLRFKAVGSSGGLAPGASAPPARP